MYTTSSTGGKHPLNETQNSNRGTGRIFGVDEKSEGMEKVEKQLLPGKKRRLHGGGWKAALPDIEEELVA